MPAYNAPLATVLPTAAPVIVPPAAVPVMLPPASVMHHLLLLLSCSHLLLLLLRTTCCCTCYTHPVIGPGPLQSAAAPVKHHLLLFLFCYHLLLLSSAPPGFYTVHINSRNVYIRVPVRIRQPVVHSWCALRLRRLLEVPQSYNLCSCLLLVVG